MKDQLYMALTILAIAFVVLVTPAACSYHMSANDNAAMVKMVESGASTVKAACAVKSRCTYTTSTPLFKKEHK